jgi:hypothetical protein
MSPFPKMSRSLLFAGLILATACSKEPVLDDTGTPTSGDVFISIAPSVPDSTFGDLFRAVNLDAGKGMNGTLDYDRIERLMCSDPNDCTPGPVRFWNKVPHGRFTLESPLGYGDVIQELHQRGFPILWSFMGVPAFLRDTCTGCLLEVEVDDGEGGFETETYHILRELELDADDPKNPSDEPISCTCEDSDWAAGMPATTAVGGVSWLDYIAQTTSDLLDNFDSTDADLSIGIWNEPDQIWWKGTQTEFAAMWCATAEAVRDRLDGRTDVRIGGPDISAWSHPIGGVDTPLLEAIQSRCGDDDLYDFLTYHQYSESGTLLFEDSVEQLRSWGEVEELPVHVGEYAASLGHGAEDTTLCDPTAIASGDGDVPNATGEDSSSVLCDHRGAVEDIAMAASMAGQDHGLLYRFEVWDWGTTDMVDSRMGLLTINNIPKPTATSFWMMSQLQGERLAVINELDGANPYHLLASREGDEIVIVVAAQNRTVSEQFVRGLLSQGLRYNEDVAPLIVGCPEFEADDPEANLSNLATEGITADQIIDDCPTVDQTLADAIVEALDYAAPRVGIVGDSFDLTIEVAGWEGSATRHRIDAYRNTYAEGHRRWPELNFGEEESEGTVSYTTAEEDLWEYMTTPLDELEVVDGQLTIEVRPDSVTMLRGQLTQ